MDEYIAMLVELGPEHKPTMLHFQDESYARKHLEKLRGQGPVVLTAIAHATPTMFGFSEGVEDILLEDRPFDDEFCVGDPAFLDEILELIEYDEGTCGICGALIDREIVQPDEPYHEPDADCRSVRIWQAEES